MSLYWVLDGTDVRPASLEEWLKQRPPVRLARDERDDVVISTIFVGLDTEISTPPFLFETMVFGGPHHGERQIYRTWIEAAVGHGAMVRKVFE